MDTSPPSSVAPGHTRLAFRTLIRPETTDGLVVSYVEDDGLWETPAALYRYRRQPENQTQDMWSLAPSPPVAVWMGAGYQDPWSMLGHLACHQKRPPLLGMELHSTATLRTQYSFARSTDLIPG